MSEAGVLERNLRSQSGVVEALVQGVHRQPVQGVGRQPVQGVRRQPVQGVGMAVQRMGMLEGRPVRRAVVVLPGGSSVGHDMIFRTRRYPADKHH